MRRSKIIRDQRSILNTDAFDKRRFQEIFAQSEGLQRLRDETGLPAADSLLRDLWATLYKMKPSIVQGRIPDPLKPNRTILEKWMSLPQYEELHSQTKLDDLSAILSTLSFGEKLNGWITELKEKEGDYQELFSKAKGSREQAAAEALPEHEASSELDPDSEELDKALRFILEQDGDRFSQAAEEAMEDALRIKNHTISLLGSMSGSGDADLKRIPLRDQLAVADKVARDVQIQEIAEWAGRFKQIARDKQQKEYTEAMERRGITFGDELERLLPAELGMYTHPVVKKEFLRRFAQGETMQFDQKKRDDIGKGPIVFCLDQSTSMRGLENQSKGFVLALLSIAKKQHRDVCVILFSTETKCLTYKRGAISAGELELLATAYLGGGTDFSLALKKALHVIGEYGFAKADVVFVTDGEDEVSESFIERFLKWKKEKRFQMLSLVMGDESPAIQALSDRVVHVDNFDDEGSFTAFEL